MRKFWDSLPTFAKVLVILAGIVLFAVLDQVVPEVDRTPTTATATPKPTKSTGERVFGSALIGYTEADDGRILVAWKIANFDKAKIEREVQRFMSNLAKEQREWTSVTLSGHGMSRDEYGKEAWHPVYTVTIERSEADKVENWLHAKIDVIGHVEAIHPKLR